MLNLIQVEQLLCNAYNTCINYESLFYINIFIFIIKILKSIILDRATILIHIAYKLIYHLCRRIKLILNISKIISILIE